MHDLRLALTDPDRRRRLASLIVLIIASLATVATTAAVPSLQAKATGQVEAGEGQTVERSLVIHLDRPSGQVPGSGRLRVDPVTLDGTQGAGRDGLAIHVLDSTGSPLASSSSFTWWFDGELPVADCVPSCDLAYRLVFTSTDPDAALATVRFDVDVDFRFPNESGVTAPGRLTIDLEGPPIVNGQWIAIAAALIGLFVGVVMGRRLTGPGRVRFAPGIALLVVLLAAAVSSFLAPTSVDAPLWDTVWFIALAVGLARALYRWERGDPDGVAIAGHAVVLIGGILFVGNVGLLPDYRLAILVPASFAVGWLVGAVDAQGLAIHTPAGRLRFWPTTFAVVSQGIIAIGLVGFVVVSTVSGPWSSYPVVSATGLVVPAIIVMFLVAIGLRRWFAGRGRMMGIVNVLLLVVGAVGLLGMSAMYFGDPGFLVDWGPAAAVSLGTCVVGIIAAIQAPPRRVRPPYSTLPPIDERPAPA